MPQVVLFLDGHMVRQRGMAAPRRASDIRHWIRMCQRTFASDLTAANRAVHDLRQVHFVQRVEPEEIRLNFPDFNIGFVIKRQEDALAR